MNLYFKRLASPIGELSLYASDTALVGLFFPKADPGRLETIYPGAREKENDILAKTSEELRAYFADRLKGFTVPVAVSGTDFQKAVWNNLQTIGFGELRSYADVARSIGRPKAVRAVGGAIGSNTIPIIIPCHRVIGSNGSLTGFGGGLDTKERLLKIEGHVIDRLKIIRSRP
jgi:methylated-DNA-[protein]-cysteine S-methyltransferase